MRGPPIPQRIAPMVWRKPAFIWTPLALTVAIGAPALFFQNDGALAQLALIAGAGVYALALSTLGAAWALGRAPRSRREVMLHVLAAGLIATLAAPFLMTELLAVISDDQAARETFTLAMALSMTPLALVLGLPIALASGIAFAMLALQREPGPREDDIRHGVQPFR